MRKKLSAISYQLSASRDGFTLIELLVVISIIGVLSAVLMANISGIRERARDARRKADLKEIKNALRMYHTDCDDYPPDSSSKINGCGTCTTSAACDWGGTFANNTSGTVYMKVLPNDPLNENDPSRLYTYTRTDRDTFSLKAVLENASDTDIAKSQALCGITNQDSTNNYYVCQD